MTSDGSENRVYIVSPTESELTTRGKRHPNLARHLSGRGWTVEYLSSNFSHAEKRLFSDEEYAAAKTRLPYGLSLIKNGAYRRNLSLQRILWNHRFAYRAYRLLDRGLREGDVLIVPSRPPELIYAAAMLKQRRKCRIVLDIRDIWPDALNESSRNLRRGFGVYCDFFLRRSVAKFDAYIHVAPSFLPWLHRYAPAAQSTFIPLGFDEVRWRGGCPRQPSAAHDGLLKLVYCGTVTNQFDIMPVLQAIAKRPGRFHLTLIGDNGTGERYADVMRFIHYNGLDVHTKVLGLLVADRLVEELPRHDIAIVPMVSGALPNKVFDSIAAGVPMLALGSGDAAAFIEQHDLGWTAPFDSEAVGRVLDGVSCADIAEKSCNAIRHRPRLSQKSLFLTYEAVLRELS